MQINKLHHYWPTVIAAVASIHLSAQTEDLDASAENAKTPYILEPYTSSATTTKTSFFETGANVSVISADDINEQLLSSKMALADQPAPDLCIRTGGEWRLSNFLLWQFAYAELWFTDTLWPDFNVDELDEAITHFSSRERRFGGRPAEALV